jgi:murein DD-endopeptidase MepM/ murein hydrolase activator NlpD
MLKSNKEEPYKDFQIPIYLKISVCIIPLATLFLCSCQISSSHSERQSSPVKRYAINSPTGLDVDSYNANLKTYPDTSSRGKFSAQISETQPIPYVPYEYIAQSGDTIRAVAARFRVQPQEITSIDPIPAVGLLTPGQILNIPRQSDEIPVSPLLLPDSEVVYSDSAADFDVSAYIERAGGYLSTRKEFMRSTGMTSAADILTRVALENSFDPRLLLALLEYRCGCVLGYPDEEFDTTYLLGHQNPVKKGLYRQLGWAVNQLSLGYYGWRDGLLTNFYFLDGTVSRIPPKLNAGSVAIQYLFAQLYDSDEWQLAIDPNKGLPALYARMFGDPWQRDSDLDPLLPGNLTQPELILPFQPGDIWSYTSGPHKAWETEGALAALDFAPPSIESGCLPSDAWVVASASGLIVRAEHGAVVLDLDATDSSQNSYSTLSDGNEHTGWAILYMHISEKDRVSVGTHLQTGDPIGHPSCEGGPATGTHMHIARKFHGEWIAADGPIPFVMDGWIAKAGYRPFEGTLVRDGVTINANLFSPGYSFISRDVPETTQINNFILKNQNRRWICE